MLPDLKRRWSKPIKNRIKRELDRRGYELMVDPFAHRLVRMIQTLDIDTVIDGGANVGQYAMTLRSAGFAGRILSVEPLSSAYASLAASASDDPLWTTRRAALSDGPGQVTINISGNSVSSSALPMLAAHSDAAPDSVYVGTEDVATTTIDDLVAEHGIDPSRTLLKLDVQGFEKTALAGAKATIQEFAATQLELSYVPLYEGQWLAADVEGLMGDCGYVLWMFDQAAMHDPATGRLLQCDGVFVRS